MSYSVVTLATLFCLPLHKTDFLSLFFALFFHFQTTMWLSLEAMFIHLAYNCRMGEYGDSQLAFNSISCLLEMLCVIGLQKPFIQIQIHNCKKCFTEVVVIQIF